MHIEGTGGIAIKICVGSSGANLHHALTAFDSLIYLLMATYNLCGRVDESSPESSLDIIKANYKAQGDLTTLTQITDTGSHNWICVTLDLPSQL
ncbi:hypothetical protein ACTXT7_001803 [Hymenolepis weldensis]